jgi:hypothetical protein
MLAGFAAGPRGHALLGGAVDASDANRAALGASTFDEYLEHMHVSCPAGVLEMGVPPLNPEPWQPCAMQGLVRRVVPPTDGLVVKLAEVRRPPAISRRVLRHAHARDEQRHEIVQLTQQARDLRIRDVIPEAFAPSAYAARCSRPLTRPEASWASR